MTKIPLLTLLVPLMGPLPVSLCKEPAEQGGKEDVPLPTLTGVPLWAQQGDNADNKAIISHSQLGYMLVLWS